MVLEAASFLAVFGKRLTTLDDHLIRPDRFPVFLTGRHKRKIVHPAGQEANWVRLRDPPILLVIQIAAHIQAEAALPLVFLQHIKIRSKQHPVPDDRRVH